MKQMECMRLMTQAPKGKAPVLAKAYPLLQTNP